MDIKTLFKNIFYYTPPNEYNFSLPYTQETCINFEPQKNELDKIENIFPNINMNLNYIKSKYNVLINSDIIIRDFILNVSGKKYKAFLLYIDGMVDSEIMNDFVLKPLMMNNQNNLFNKKLIYESTRNNVKIRKIPKINLQNIIKNSLIPQNNLKEEKKFSKIFSGINSGNIRES